MRFFIFVILLIKSCNYVKVQITDENKIYFENNVLFIHLNKIFINDEIHLAINTSLTISIFQALNLLINQNNILIESINNNLESFMKDMALVNKTQGMNFFNFLFFVLFSYYYSFLYDIDILIDNKIINTNIFDKQKSEISCENFVEITYIKNFGFKFSYLSIYINFFDLFFNNLID